MPSNCVYHEKTSKYTCPSCQIRTCSIECVQKHKFEKDCSGKREIKFVGKQDLKHIAKLDCQFLQQIGDSIEFTKHIAKRNIKKRPIKKIAAICAPFKIIWQAAPLGLDCANQNRTRVKDESIYWSVQLNRNNEDFLIHDINGLSSLHDIVVNLKVDLTKTVLIYVYQQISNNVHSQKKWTNIAEQRWGDSFFHSLVYGILPGEHVIVQEYPRLRIKVID